MKHSTSFLGYADPDRQIFHLYPEHKLFAAVLVQAVSDALGSGFREQHIRNDARFWLSLDEPDWRPCYDAGVVAFEEVCSILDLCPKSVHKRLRALEGEKNPIVRRKVITRLGGLLGWG